jgi:predicted GIY-YIG superfamily endonuclease
MESVLLLIVAVAVLAYYGVMASLEEAAEMANKEVKQLSRQHKVSIIKRTAELEVDISEEVITKASEVLAKLNAMKDL